MSETANSNALRKSQFFHRVLTNNSSNLSFDQQTLEDLWQQYDANQNGDLELNEIQAMMQGQKQFIRFRWNLNLFSRSRQKHERRG